MVRTSSTVSMSLLRDWLDSLAALFQEGGSGPSDRHLAELAEEAERASPGTRWAVFNRLGDAYLKTGDRPRALRYFGKAIDALLEDDQPEPARAVAKKVIRLHPEAVRTLCTLTWLDLASTKIPAAVASLREYVDVAKEGNRERLACGQVLEMARLASHPDFLEEVVKALDALGCTADSGQAKEWAAQGGSPSAPKDPKRLYALCMKAAIGSNLKLMTKGALA
jgi:tetratricopeptide (TPR) repeat protein